VYLIPMIERTCGLISAAPSPWSKRARTNAPARPAAAHATLASVNSAIPTEKYAPATNLIPESPRRDEPRCERHTVTGDEPLGCAGACNEIGLLDGSPTFTMKKSRTIRNVPVSRTGRATHL
jgi:hypothetical protein